MSVPATAEGNLKDLQHLSAKVCVRSTHGAISQNTARECLTGRWRDGRYTATLELPRRFPNAQVQHQHVSPVDFRMSLLHVGLPHTDIPHEYLRFHSIRSRVFTAQSRSKARARGYAASEAMSALASDGIFNVDEKRSLARLDSSLALSDTTVQRPQTRANSSRSSTAAAMPERGQPAAAVRAQVRKTRTRLLQHRSMRKRQMLRHTTNVQPLNQGSCGIDSFDIAHMHRAYAVWPLGKSTCICFQVEQQAEDEDCAVLAQKLDHLQLVVDYKFQDV